MDPFIRDVRTDSECSRAACLHPRRGLHHYFRLSGPAMQRRFAELLPLAEIPQAFLHGNPHLDNYVKTARGAAMADFDRARIGPYAYDLVRFWVSLSLRARKIEDDRLHPVVLATFRRGYAYGARGLGSEGVGRLLRKDPKPWQMSTRAYVAAGGPWAQRLREHPVCTDDPRLLELLRSYLGSRDELDQLEAVKVVAAAEVCGSMGKKHLVVLLDPHDPADDQRLVDIKETYDEPDTPWFRNPFPHNGQRMVAAGELHAPGWELAPGHATWNGRQYWCRQLPTHKIKLRTTLREFEQVDVAFAVGTQLGGAHRRSMADVTVDEHIAHFESHFDAWVDLARTLRRELRRSHAAYVHAVAQLESDAPRFEQRTG
jgi:hypothetical protein